MGRRRARLLCVAAALVPAHAVCNLTKFELWKAETAEDQTQLGKEKLGLLREDGFWGLTQSLTYSNFLPTWGIMMDKAAKMCRQSLTQLTRDTAGRHGEITDFYIYDSMCSLDCLDSDTLHLEAMRQSGCSCLELSPQHGAVSFHIEGEVCHRNSARQLCAVFDKCGIWNCDLADFMCPRHEYNKQWTRLKGPGDCSAAAGAKAAFALLLPLAAALFNVYVL
ncbi:hypothetical protein M885DRAFT_528104 [Pelagophyceae sp. CCMP2097]|nr:hypothetical protein M885DRAFT_528104 [Pelagophyceae sp. CCMP2097]